MSDGPQRSLRRTLLTVAAGLRVDALFRGVERVAPPRVRLAVIHGTPRRHEAKFRAHVAWVTRHFEVLGPVDLFRVLRGELSPPSGTSVAFTFDDGFLDNAEVASSVLEEAGTRGLFFVVPGFVLARDAALYFKEHFGVPGEPEDLADVQPMRVADVKALVARGHVVGNHTFSHASLDRLRPEEAREEIRRGREAIEGWTEMPCRAFAWTFAWNRIDAESYAFARSTHEFCFAACPGTNRLPLRADAPIWRTTVDARAGTDELRFFYSGLADPIWARRRRSVRKTLAPGRDGGEHV